MPMQMLEDLLHTAKGVETIKQCWGEVPQFKWGDVIHFKLGMSERSMILTACFITGESDDWNKCKPSKITIEFAGISFFEMDVSGCAQNNGIQLDNKLHSPEPGTIAINIHGSVSLICQSLRVLSCVHDPNVERK